MKHSRLLAASFAAAALTLTPAAAFGYSEPGSGNIIIEDQTPEDCQFPVTIDIEPTTLQVTLTVTDANGAVVYEVTKFNDGSNSVDFSVNLGAGCDGAYTLTATDELGQVLATANVVADNGPTSPVNPGGGDTGGDTGGVVTGDTGDNVGGLPATGSSDAMLVSGLAGAGLLAGGSLLLVRRRRAAA